MQLLKEIILQIKVEVINKTGTDFFKQHEIVLIASNKTVFIYNYSNPNKDGIIIKAVIF